MGVDPGLKIGEKVNLQKIREIFQCGSMGGMLPVNRTNVMGIRDTKMVNYIIQKPMGCNCIYLRFLRNANIFIEE